MPLLIDTYNVLHTTGVLPPELAGLDVAGLAQLVSASRYRRKKATFVCDGQSSKQPSLPNPGLHKLVYSGPRRSADEVIHDLIKKSSDPRRLIIISSDREIRQSARRRRAKSITSEIFLKNLTVDTLAHDSGKKPASSHKKVTKKQVKEWIATFGLNPTEQRLNSASMSSAKKTPKKKRKIKRRKRAKTALPDYVIDEAERLYRQG